VASITADFISIAFFGHETTFNYDTVTLALHHYWILVLMGVVLGFAGAGYNIAMVWAQKMYKRITKIPAWLKMGCVFLVSGIVGLTMPQILCGGHSMAAMLMHDRPELTVLFVLLFAKFIFGAFSFSSGAPGGTLYPLCVLGAYIGAIFGNIAINNIGIRGGLYEEFVVLGMAGLFSSIVRAPLTGIILVFELTGDMHSLLPIATVSLISYAVANTIGTAPFYSILFEKAVENTNAPVLNTKEVEKVLQTFTIPVGSPVANKTIADIDWGKHCVIISVERDETPITPKGDTLLKEGDTLVILISQRRFSQDVQRICDMIKKPRKIKS
jgi:H+/Cl- antiporter ClcA